MNEENGKYENVQSYDNEPQYKFNKKWLWGFIPYLDYETTIKDTTYNKIIESVAFAKNIPNSRVICTYDKPDNDHWIVVWAWDKKMVNVCF